MVFNSSSVQAAPPAKGVEPVLNLHLTLGSGPTHLSARAPPHTISLLKLSLSQGPALSTLIPQAPPHTHLSSPKSRSLQSLIPSPASSLSPQAPPSAQLRPRPRPRPSALKPRLRKPCWPHLLRLAQLTLQRLLQLTVLAAAPLLLLLQQTLGLPLRLLQQLQLL